MARSNAGPATRPPPTQPLYQRVLGRLREDVRHGRLRERLPSEPDLAERYRVSRMTLRRAIAALVDEGVLESRHGAGTFVADSGGTSRIIALLINPQVGDAAGDPYLQQVLSHLLHACARRGWTIRLASGIESMTSRLAAGRGASVAACVAMLFGARSVDRLAALPVPLLLVDCDPLPDVPQVTVESAGAMRAAVARLAALGHRRIAHAAGPEYALNARERVAAFTAAMREVGLPIADGHLIPGPFDANHGHAAMTRLSAAAAPPTAVLCANDQIAFGVTRWLAERSLRVGRDVSVVGCDGLLADTLVTPELSTLALDFTGFAEKILQAVLEIGKAGVRRESVVFIERGSVGPAPPA